LLRHFFCARCLFTRPCLPGSSRLLPCQSATPGECNRKAPSARFLRLPHRHDRSHQRAVCRVLELQGGQRPVGPLNLEHGQQCPRRPHAQRLEHDSRSLRLRAQDRHGNKPVNLASWYDSIRVANCNQGLGDTETSAYTLLGGMDTPSNGLSITRNSVGVVPAQRGRVVQGGLPSTRCARRRQ